MHYDIELYIHYALNSYMSFCKLSNFTKQTTLLLLGVQFTYRIRSDCNNDRKFNLPDFNQLYHLIIYSTIVSY